MIARAEISANPQNTEPQSSAPPKGMSVALIGPNDAHRKVVAKALASAQGRKVHEFVDYPASLDDLARMMEAKFDVVLVDVDTDESYALQIIARLADLGPTIMAYSARTDEDLLASCMRAGAKDFLPLPEESASAAAAPTSAPPQAAPTQAVPTPQPAVKPVAPPAPRPVATVPPPAAKPIEAQPSQLWRSNATPSAPQGFPEPNADLWTPRVPEAHVAPGPPAINEVPVKIAEPVEQSNPNADFAAWDAANLRRASMPPVSRPEPSPRLAPEPEKIKSIEPVAITPVEEVSAEEVPLPVLGPAPVIERPPISADIFRSTGLNPEPSEIVEKHGTKWVKWILIGAGPLVLGLVLLIVFTRSSASSSAAAAKTAPAPEPTTAAVPAEPDPATNDRLIVNATGKPDAGKPATPAKTTNAAVPPQPAASSPSNPSNTTTEEAKDVSPDAMAAQLVAPTRIRGQISTKPPVDEPPPAAPSGASLEDNNSVSGAVFGSAPKVRVAHPTAISEGVAAGMLIRKTPPSYPKYAQDAHISGVVTMRATITKQGTIEGIQVLSGPKILAPPAVDAVKTWRYRPYMLDGQPVAVETDIKVVFGNTAH